MKSFSTPFCGRAARVLALGCVSLPVLFAAPQSAEKAKSAPTAAPAPATPPSATGKLFDTPKQAADALIEASSTFDIPALGAIFGPDGANVIFSGEYAQDKKHAMDFATQAKEKETVSVEPKNGKRAFLLVGTEEWPFPIPLVQRGTKWFFDSKAGEQELMYRRIGANENDAIDICHGYVEAQNEYAEQSRNVHDVNQYAQRILSSPGKHDGLAWQNADGTWGGPVGENIARAIEQGYNPGAEPYHGYFFKILKGQGPDAPLGEMDYVVKDIMIGGFALVAAPAEYGVTGFNTFIVSNDGVVFQKDLGAQTLQEFNKMERFNPDKSWTPVEDNN